MQHLHIRHLQSLSNKCLRKFRNKIRIDTQSISKNQYFLQYSKKLNRACKENSTQVDFICYNYSQISNSPQLQEFEMPLQQPDPKIRTLLMLWDMGGEAASINKSKLLEKVKKGKENAKDFQPILAALENAGAIEQVTEKRVVKVSLTDRGVQMLGTALQQPDFRYAGNIGSKVVNALLNWIGKMGSVASASVAVEKIEGYEAFKQVALDVYDHLNRDFNLDDLVPIYRIRREIGDRVSRSEFNEWLLEMQENDFIQLIGGEMIEITPDIAEDSIKTDLGAVRYYIKRLNSSN
jgi:DNA-binding PadR family transcriptional regulator